MTLKNRLGKLDQNLTMKQYMVLMVDEMQQSESLGDYSISHGALKWTQIATGFEPITEGIRAKMKGCDKDRIEHAVSKAHREGVFLYLLLGRAMSKYQGENYRHAYNGLMLNNLLKSAEICSLHQMANPKASLESHRAALEEIKEILDTFKARASRHLYHLWMEQRITEEISNRYFDGRDLMFSQDRFKLESMLKEALNHIAVAQRIVDDLPLLQDSEAFSPFVDLDAIRAEVKQDLEKHVQYEVDMIKAEALNSLGQLGQGQAILEEYGKRIASGEKLV